MKRATNRFFVLLALSLFVCMGLSSKAQTYKLRATSLAYMSYDERYDRWTDWTDWEECNILVVMSLDRERVTIYSKETQEYDVVELIEEGKRDRDGGTSTKLLCVDADGLRCHMRLRTQSDNQLQLYIEYSDFRFVYNVESKN